MAEIVTTDVKAAENCSGCNGCKTSKDVPRLSITTPPASRSRASSPSPRIAYPAFNATLNTHFPGAQRESSFWDCCVAALDAQGFQDDNTIACIGVCRDEICSTLMDEVKKRFGDLFIFRGLVSAELAMLWVTLVGFAVRNTCNGRIVVSMSQCFCCLLSCTCCIRPACQEFSLFFLVNSSRGSPRL